ncbi:hypothetical protein F4808DRAFT_454302 [Astrocystis sublimbata]|nr:hypothetical protein F4808DRAFT_454302 [Astrocystis sublimbata]
MFHLKECIEALSNTGPATIIIAVPIRIIHSDVRSKRKQVIAGVLQVKTKIAVLCDDHVFPKPRWLQNALYAFHQERVGLVGTRKKVRRQNAETHSYWDWQWLWKSCWNFVGIFYLERYNFETRATNAADGGVFCVSGRALLVRTCILLGPDDDNFITRWVTESEWDIKIQYTDEAIIETVLGDPDKFIRLLLCIYLWLWILLAKLPKLMAYFRSNRRHWIFFPLQVVWAWFHSFIKFYAALTCLDTSWLGREQYDPTTPQ